MSKLVSALRKREVDTNELDHVEKVAIPNAGHSDGGGLRNRELHLRLVTITATKAHRLFNGNLGLL
jgi:hypothetical protein